MNLKFHCICTWYFDFYCSDQFQDILSSEEVIPLTILRKYIAYARQWVKPKLSEPAANILLQFYLDLRQNYKMVCGVPVFSRQLEALIRLTEVCNFLNNFI